jgi:hypothetical protein
MPILPEYRHLYATAEWRAIRVRIVVDRARYRCEHCNEQAGQPYLNKRKKWCTVQLGVAHLDQDPTNNADSNLAALCRACHLAHDRATHTEHAHFTRATKKDAARPLLQEAIL